MGIAIMAFLTFIPRVLQTGIFYYKTFFFRANSEQQTFYVHSKDIFLYLFSSSNGYLSDNICAKYRFLLWFEKHVCNLYGNSRSQSCFWIYTDYICWSAIFQFTQISNEA
jgi:hypothetical protein